jgi:hypothetical protein
MGIRRDAGYAVFIAMPPRVEEYHPDPPVVSPAGVIGGAVIDVVAVFGGRRRGGGGGSPMPKSTDE